MAQVVHKFGGSSLSSAERYQAVANILLSQSQLGDVVVVSAAGKTTDTLVRLWQAFDANDSRGCEEVIALLHSHQQNLIAGLLSDELAAQALAQLGDELAGIASLCKENLLQEAPLLAHGEVWSARLLSLYLRQLGCKAQDIDARALLRAQNGQLLHLVNAQACQQQLATDQFNVVTGFIASDEQGNTITLGRNGSDYSATLLAKYTHAKEVCIWTDTTGVFSTDPRKVEQAVKYHKVCREQANLLARLGNPVLHAKTLSPLKDLNTKLSVRSSFDADASGTEIVPQGYCKSKSFLTTLQDCDVLSVESLEPGEVGRLSQQIGHTLVHFKHEGNHFLLVPSLLRSDVAAGLGARAQLHETNLNGVAIVAPQNEIVSQCLKAQTQLDELSFTVRFVHRQQDFALILCDQKVDADTLSLLHNKIVAAHRQVALIVAGVGNVGQTFIEQLTQQVARLNSDFEVKLVALLRSKQMLIQPCGVDLAQWQNQWQHNAQDYDNADLITHLEQLDYEHKVVIDITASEAFSELYPRFAEAGCHLISANKYAGTADFNWYNTLQQNLKDKGLQWRYNTSVGAGLPINFCLKDMQRSGDTITRIQGVFSGTLSWLCSHYEQGKSFAELVFEAKELGYTEPDPREDLSGRDVQRKLLILARELGLNLNLDDIALTALMPDSLAQGSWDDFVANSSELDAFVQQKAEQAASNGNVLSYNADIQISKQGVKAQVGLVEVPPSSAFAQLTPGDNLFVVHSQWYQDNPLIIQGPGAGREVTAAGVHSDLYWLIQGLN